LLRLKTVIGDCSTTEKLIKEPFLHGLGQNLTLELHLRMSASGLGAVIPLFLVMGGQPNRLVVLFLKIFSYMITPRITARTRKAV
jgi:hypothetical protein